MAGEDVQVLRRSIRTFIKTSVEESKKKPIVEEDNRRTKRIKKKPKSSSKSKIKKISDNLTPLPEIEILELAITILESKDRRHFFAEPVDPEMVYVEFYYETIHEPMDFSTIKSKIRAGKYQYLEQLQYDVDLIWGNALEFNYESTVYFKRALVLEDLAKKVMNELKMEPQRLKHKFRKLIGNPKKRQSELESVKEEEEDTKRQKQDGCPNNPQLACKARYTESLTGFVRGVCPAEHTFTFPDPPELPPLLSLTGQLPSLPAQHPYFVGPDARIPWLPTSVDPVVTSPVPLTLGPTIHPNEKGKGIFNEEPDQNLCEGGMWVPQDDLLFEVTSYQMAGPESNNLGPYANHLKLVKRWLENANPKPVVHPTSMVIPNSNDASSSQPTWDPLPIQWSQYQPNVNDFNYDPEFFKAEPKVSFTDLLMLDEWQQMDNYDPPILATTNQVCEVALYQPAPAAPEFTPVDNPHIGEGWDQAGPNGGAWGGYGGTDLDTELLCPDNLKLYLFSTPPPPL